MGRRNLGRRQRKKCDEKEMTKNEERQRSRANEADKDGTKRRKN